MYRTIKKHPFAFLHCLSWLIMGLCMAYVMHHDSSDYYDVPYADTIVILFFVSLTVLVLSPIIGMIVKRIRRPDPATRKERRFLRAAARGYESTRPGFNWCYLLAVLPLVLPLLAFFSVMWIDLYMPAVLFAAIGISIWLFFLCHEYPENKLLTATVNPHCFQIQQGVQPSRLDDLYQRGVASGISEKLWESRQNHLYNMLLQEGYIDERSTITGCALPPSAIEDHFGIRQEMPDDEPVIWIPFSQFSIHDGPGKGYAAIQRLFTHHFNAIVDRRFEYNRESDSSSYPFSSVDVRLQPDETAVLCETDGQLQLFAASATNPAPYNDLIYQGCMLQVEEAVLEDIKWDFFETAGDPEDDREHYLSPEEARSLYQMVLEGTFTYEIFSLTYLEKKQQIALEIWLEPNDHNGLPLEGMASNFALDDGMGYLLLLSYDRLRWHWFQTRHMEKPYLFY